MEDVAEPEVESRAEAELAALQEDIYRQKVLRARGMTPEERFAEVLELSQAAMQRVYEGAAWQLASDDPAIVWAEVRRRLDRLDAVEDWGHYANERDAAHRVS